MTKRYDPLTPEERSIRMSLIKGRNTKPELFVRSLVHGMGFRFRLHDRSLPGKPDLVFKGRRKVIFVNGCFWHQHGCGRYKMPKTRKSFWLGKLKSNVIRDGRIRNKLRYNGWGVMTIWDCDVRDIGKLQRRVMRFLGG